MPHPGWADPTPSQSCSCPRVLPAIMTGSIMGSPILQVRTLRPWGTGMRWRLQDGSWICGPRWWAELLWGALACRSGHLSQDLSSPLCPSSFSLSQGPVFGGRQCPRWVRNVAADLGPELGEGDKPAPPLHLPLLVSASPRPETVHSQSPAFPGCRRGERVLGFHFQEPEHGQSSDQPWCSWILLSRRCSGDRDPDSQPLLAPIC